MLGRTLATVLLLLASQLASGCCGCYRPFFCCKQRFYGGYGGCCEPCTACYGGAAPAPIGPPVAIAPPAYPVYNTLPMQPAVPTQATPPASTPANNPPIDRIPSFGAAIPTSGLHR
jgi:hypothetical protein